MSNFTIYSSLKKKKLFCFILKLKNNLVPKIDSTDTNVIQEIMFDSFKIK